MRRRSSPLLLVALMSGALTCAVGALALAPAVLPTEVPASGGDVESTTGPEYQRLRNQCNQAAREAKNLDQRHATVQQALEKQKEDNRQLSQTLARDQDQLAKLEQANREKQALAEALQERQNAAEMERDKLMEQERVLNQAVERLRDMARTAPPPVYVLKLDRPMPLCLECDGDGVVVRPGGLRLSRKEVTEGAALRKLVKARPTEQSAKSSVLLLVRPSGIMTFYGVLKVLQADTDVHWEFVEEDWNLDFGAAQ